MIAPVFERLGLKRIINAADTYSVIGGSVVDADIAAAMAEAATRYVSISALQDAVGEKVAAIMRAEAACIVPGAAAGLAIATAALLAGTDPAAIAALPVRRAGRGRFVIQRCQRIPYDHAVRMLGIDLVEIGLADQAHGYELEAALAEGADGILCVAGTTFERFGLPLADVVRIARPYGVPVIVDAAAQLPPAENLWVYGEAGADLVVFSGGKGLRGPQGSGIIAGRADLVAACRANMSPNHGIGRAMKIGREQIVGLLLALERFVARDWDAILAGWEVMVAKAVERLDALPGVSARRIYPGRLGQAYPRALVTWDESLKLSRETLLADLLAGDPEIHLGLADDAMPGVNINPFPLADPAELDIVLDRLTALLQAAKASSQEKTK